MYKWILLQGLEGNVQLNTVLVSLIGILLTVLWFFIQAKMKSYDSKLTDLEDATEKVTKDEQEARARLQREFNDAVTKVDAKYEKINDSVHKFNMDMMKELNLIGKDIVEFKRLNLK